MKKEEVWKPKKVEYESEVFEVGEKIENTVFIKSDSLAFAHDFKEGIIAGFEKLHYKTYIVGCGSFSNIENCTCPCHSLGSKIEEPCEKCKNNDVGYIVTILVPRTIHISRLTKTQENGKND